MVTGTVQTPNVFPVEGEAVASPEELRRGTQEQEGDDGQIGKQF